jgi:TPP-dependent indolepyruvate ferredoxin oxidoreductase alpha subunit
MMAMLGGYIQIKQVDIHITLNMVHRVEHHTKRTGIEKVKNFNNMYRSEIQEENSHGIELPGYISVKVVTQKYPSMINDNYLDCLLYSKIISLGILLLAARTKIQILAPQ